jgi:O-methyltransferase
MELHKTIAKSGILALMRLVEAHCHYYLARSNRFYPLVNPIIGIRALRPQGCTAAEAWAYGVDKVQHGLTQLISHEISLHGVAGAVAEVGVYRGFNASVMNHFFPDRTLYLFDTFQGFDSRDVAMDAHLGYDTSRYHNFSDTSIDLVISRMPHRENVIVRQGWFPDTAVGLEDETFSFVTLDADLYQPTQEGLRWFYPRLARGGYIVVDDVNWNDYPGVRKAVQEFCMDAGISYIPIPNATGGVVIGKPLTPQR